MEFIGHDGGLTQCEDIMKVQNTLFGFNGFKGLCEMVEENGEMLKKHQSNFDKLTGFGMVSAVFSVITTLLMFWKFVFKA